MPYLIIVMIIIVIMASIIEFKSERDKRLYECYLRQNFKGNANAWGCQGSGTPDCNKCYYHKLYLKRKAKNDFIK